MPKQRKLFTLSDEAVRRLGILSVHMKVSMSELIESLINQAYRHHVDTTADSELCRMVWDDRTMELRFEDMAGGVLAVFHLSS